MECGGIGALPPVTLFEITLGKGLDEDYYDVSLVDGYNLPVVAAPRVLHGGCNATGCLADLNRGKKPMLISIILQSKPASDHHIRITKAPQIQQQQKKATTKARS